MTDAIGSRTGQRPRISVILVVEAQRERGARCLASVLEQSVGDALEVLLIDVGASGSVAIAGSHDPRVRVLHRPASVPFGRMLADAVGQARAPLVAFLEEHCVALPGWAGALVRADRGEPVIALGGARYDPAPSSGLSAFVHLLDMGPWSPPAVDCAVRALPEGNVAYRRDGLLRYGDRLAVYFRCEGLLHAQLIKDGLTLRVVPDARYEHAYESSLRALCARWYAMGWVAGATKAELAGWSVRQRTVDIARRLSALPLSPVGQLVRLARRRPDGRRLVLANLHVGVLWCWVFTVGELLGTVFGLRGMDARVRHHVLNGSRQASPGPRRRGAGEREDEATVRSSASPRRDVSR